MGPTMGTQIRLMGVSVAWVLALQLNPEQGTGVYPADSSGEEPICLASQSPLPEAPRSCRFQYVGWWEKYPVVPTAGMPQCLARPAPALAPDYPGTYLGGRYGRHPAVKSRESRHSGKSPQC